MFHTFEGFENPNARKDSRSQSRDGRTPGRRVSTVRACEQCRRRKIRCDGEQPCEACQWYKKADLCQYTDPRPSRRHVEKLSSTLEEYKKVVEKLFPGVPIENLTSLSRENLLELASESKLQPTQEQGPSQQLQQQHPSQPQPSQAQHQPQQQTSSPATSPAVETHVSPLSPEDENLESLQAMPEESGDSRESRSPDLVASVSDDVNALSLSVKRPSTYLGISSVIAVMRVITWIDPDSVSFFSRSPDRPSRPKNTDDFLREGASWPPQPMRAPALPPHQPPPHLQPNGLQLINAYFAYFHAFIPLLDEASFRETFMTGKRSDARWMGLLHMVFALGSIAAYTADDTSHERYYQRARQYLTLDSLGSAHVETVQTLALMGGYYLHYVSQPNLAHSLMGAAFRMAITLGLHREFSGSNDRNHKLSADLRRRVWWSLFCLDTWAYMTLGRPSLGRCGPGITAKIPHYSSDRETALGILPLIENSRFCKIATQVGDALAASPLVNYPDMVSLDNQLVEWYNSLPPLLKTHEPCPDTISTTRTIMRWRYQNQRILLHRPVLLSYAMRRIPYVALRPDEQAAIVKCRNVADETIRDISSATRLNQMSGWNAVWFIFQATLVPLLGLFIADNTATEPTATIDSCRAQVEIAMIALRRMESWSPTAKRTLEAVSRIFNASQRNREDASTHSVATPSSRVRTSSGQSAPAPPQIGISTSSQDLNHPIIIDELSFENAGTVTTPIIEGSTTMWDYLTWSDSNMFYEGDAGMHHHQQPGPATFGAEEEFLKHLEGDIRGGIRGGTSAPIYDHNFIPYQPQ
ncbi:hypothetical protein VTO42DRAFT_7661 [Malbranchea cinnamomea]